MAFTSETSWSIVHGVNRNTLMDLDIRLAVQKFSTAYCQTNVYIAAGTSVTIQWIETVDVFKGKVVKCKKLDPGRDGGARFDIEIEETAATVLETKYVTKNGKMSVYIDNDTTVSANKKYLKDYIDTILFGSGYRDLSDASFREKQKVPATNDWLPSMGFNICTVGNALNRVLVQMMGYGVWYDDIGTGEIRYGYYNTNRGTSWPIPIQIRPSEVSKYYNIDKVYVFGDSNKVFGSAGSGSNIICYRYAGCQNSTEASAVAAQIYDIRKVINKRFEVDFPITTETLQWREGDIIDIYDDNVSMPKFTSSTPGVPDGYGVKDIKISLSKVTVGLGSAQMTVFDILSDRLSLMTGDSAAAYERSGFTEWVGVKANDPAGAKEITFKLEGSTFLGGFRLIPHFGAPGVTEDATFLSQWPISVAVGDYELEPDAWTKTIVTMGGAPSEFFWGEIVITYMFDPACSSDALATWTAEMGNAAINSDGSYVEVSQYQHTVTHKFWIEQMAGYDSGNMELTLTNTGTGTLIVRDIVIKAALIYYAGASGGGGSTPAPTTMDLDIVLSTNKVIHVGSVTGDTEVDISDAMKSAINDPSTIMSGTHKFKLTSTTDGIASIEFYYLSFDDSTEVV